MKLNKDVLAKIEVHREAWIKVAKDCGWFKEPFFLQIWLNKAGDDVEDTVSFDGLSKDIIIEGGRG